MTQAEKIMTHLEEYGSITAAEAMSEYGIMRLASRISELKKDGAPILSYMEAVQNRNGETCYVKRYYLEADCG